MLPTKNAFEITLPRDTFPILKKAGLQAEPFYELWTGLLCDARKPVEIPRKPAIAECLYPARPPVPVRITVLSFGFPTDLRIECDDSKVFKEVRTFLEEYAADHRDQIERERAHTARCVKEEEILAKEGLTKDQLHAGAKVSRGTLEMFMAMAEEVESERRTGPHMLVAQAGRAHRTFTVRWFIEQFKKSDREDQLSVRIYEMAGREIADDLIELLQNRRYGDDRGPLCLALVKTKHPRAAEVIASVMPEKDMTRWAIEALAKLKAKHHADQIAKYLTNKDPDIRREAKKTLKKFGITAEKPPEPVHLVKGRRDVPKVLEEWSANLDIEELEPALKALAACIQSGFTHPEIAEVTAVADEMNPEQTRAFRFPITAADKNSELWLVIFMDDTDSPDLRVHADKAIIEKFEAKMERLEEEKGKRAKA